jgi:hypothetical protein
VPLHPLRIENNIETYDVKPVSVCCVKGNVISQELSVKGTNYILIERTLEPMETDKIRLMLWTDYDRIPNSMQNKYFYGTIKIYAWQEIKLNV